MSENMNKDFNVMDCRGLCPRNDGDVGFASPTPSDFLLRKAREARQLRFGHGIATVLLRLALNDGQFDSAAVGHRPLHRPLFPKGRTRPSAERNSLSWMPDQVGHDTEWGQGQSGRSMVEMLGMLAIVGVLSVGAIGGYSYAMNKHRTNELIYEATKRAQWVGTQLEMNNSNPSINTFGTDSFGGGTFDAVLVNLPNNQIGIVVKDLKEAVCENIKNEIGDNTVLRAIKDSSGTADVTCEENGTASLIFNRDLGTTDPQNGGDQGGNEPEPEEPQESDVPTLDCGTHGEQVGNACECDTGWQGDDCSEQKPIDQNCSGHGYIDYYRGSCRCNTGYYGYDCSEQTTETCDDNNNCSAGYFCLYDSSSNIICNSGPSGQGKCMKVSGYRGGTKNGYAWSNTEMDWFSAENFCAAQNKDMPTIDSFECYKDGTSTVISAGSANRGYCCKANGTTCNSNDWTAGGETRSSKFASKIVSLKSTVGGDQWFWTQSLTNDSCYAFYVDLFGGGKVGFYHRGYSTYYALCR